MNSGGSFDGNDDYVEINATLFADNDTYTVSMWIKRDSIWDSGYIFFGNVRPYIYYNSSGEVTFLSGNISNSAYITNLNTWNHILGIYDGTYSKLYINGELKNLVADSKGVNSSVLVGIDSGVSFDGQIDEAKIWNYALTAEQVKTEYNGGAVRFGE